MRAGRSLSLLLGLCLLGVAAADDDELAPRWFVVPNLSWDTDDKLGFGARGELALPGAGYSPYKTAWVVHAYATTNGYGHHRVRWDRTGLAGGPLRLTAHVAWRQWRNDGYWGTGNGTVRDAAFVDGVDPASPEAKRYRYTLLQPFGHLTARWQLGEADGPWSVYGAANPKYSLIEAYAGSVLEEERPWGDQGGLAVQGLGGLLFDTRSPEVAPHSGVLAEVGGRVAPRLPGRSGDEATGFGGVFLSLRGYRELHPRVVWAGRVMGEALVGTIPFYETVHWGGFVPVAGFGGPETLRGVSFGRWRAPGKAVVGTELRIEAHVWTPGEHSLALEVAPYLDAGVVFGGDWNQAPGAAALDVTAADSDTAPIHPAAGSGVRLIYDQTFIARLDAGFGLDPVRDAAGKVEARPNLGLYVVFDHPF